MVTFDSIGGILMFDWFDIWGRSLYDLVVYFNSVASIWIVCPWLLLFASMFCTLFGMPLDYASVACVACLFTYCWFWFDCLIMLVVLSWVWLGVITLVFVYLLWFYIPSCVCSYLFVCWDCWLFTVLFVLLYSCSDAVCLYLCCLFGVPGLLWRCFNYGLIVLLEYAVLLFCLIICAFGVWCLVFVCLLLVWFCLGGLFCTFVSWFVLLLFITGYCLV